MKHRRGGDPPYQRRPGRSASGVSRRSSIPGALLAAAAISWLGLCLHNVADLPEQYPWSPETSFPTLALIVFLGVRLVSAPVGSWLLLGWAALNLIGGGVLSVLPLAFLPYDPEQSVRHYAFHAVYALSQVPLLALAWRDVRHYRITRSAQPVEDP